MSEGLRPGPEEVGPERIEDPQLAEEMARAEAPIRDKMILAKELGLGEEALTKMGIQTDELANEKRQEYEENMEEAEEIIADALTEGGRSIPDRDGKGSLELAVRSRLSEKDPKTGEIRLKKSFRIFQKQNLGLSAWHEKHEPQYHMYLEYKEE